MSAIVNRPVRTAAQGGLSYVLVEFVDAFAFDMSDRQYGAAVALLTIVLSWLQVVIENRADAGLLRDVDRDE